MALSPVQETILALIKDNPNLSNDDIAAEVRKKVPGAMTSASSVSSVKSRLRAMGMDLPKSFTLGSIMTGSTSLSTPAFEPAPEETLEEAKKRIDLRYKAMERMSRRLVKGNIPSLVISGPPGLGKSYTIKQALRERFPNGPEGEDALTGKEAPVPTWGDMDPDEDAEVPTAKHYDYVSGAITAVGLYQALWYMKDGGILILDDCDDVFRDETSLNLLKAALDSSPVRSLSWRKQAQWLEDYGIDKTFEFRGHVVFLTNIDFEAEIAKGSKMAEHYRALIDRSMYLCLTLRTRRDFMIRLNQVALDMGMLTRDFKLSKEQADEVMAFIGDNQTRFYNLSLRLVGQVAMCLRADPEGWHEDVEATKMKTTGTF